MTKSLNGFSRRRFLIRSAAAPIGALVRARGCGQIDATVEVALLREFKNTQCHAVSPDGSRICLSEISGSAQRLDPPTTLKVVKLSSWEVAYSIRLRTAILWASFFADGQSIYVQTRPLYQERPLVFEQLVAHLDGGMPEERLHLVNPGQFGSYYFAVDDRTLLGIEDGKKSLTRTSLPDYQAMLRVTLTSNNASEPHVSADRRMVVHCDGDRMIYRQSETLSLVWERPSRLRYLGSRGIAISADGRWVAAGMVDSTSYVGILDGKTGSQVARVPTEAITRNPGRVAETPVYAHDHELDISPDGRLVAFSEQEYLPADRMFQSRVLLLSVPTGRQANTTAPVIHEPVSEDRRQLDHVKSFFTSDGKHLITTGIDTKVWRLEEIGIRRNHP